MRNGRFVGVLSIGTLGATAFLLLRSKPTSAMSTGSPREQSWSPGPSGPGGSLRFPPLVERWRNAVTQRAGDLPVDAILEWIRIESGGDMCSVGGPTEVGIFQLDFPDDAKYGATLEDLRRLCQESKHHNPADISWLTESDLDMQVGAGIRKILAARDTVRHVLAQSGVLWPESSFDFGSAVKQIHATPAVITELVPKITRRDGSPPASWAALRQRVQQFPVDLMGPGLQRLRRGASKYGLASRLDDTMRNAEFVGRAWGSSTVG